MRHLTPTHIAVIVIALAGAAIIGRVIGHFVGRLAARLTHVEQGESPAVGRRLVARLLGPVSLGLTLGIWQLALVFFDLPDDARTALHDIARVLFVLAMVWLTLRLTDLIGEALGARSQFFAAHAGSRALLPLGRRVIKIVIVAIAVVALLSSLGYSVTGLIAGLGITGIAVALAAQKTLENVLGAFAIGIDQPLREGDEVRVDTTLGVVERIGLRSTRIRTPDRTVVAYPNGKLADSVIERYSARDRTRFDVHFRIALGTTGDQLRQIRDQIRALLTGHSSLAADKPSVHITGPGDAWFDLEAIAWFTTTSWSEFQDIRDQLLFDCLKVIGDARATLNGAPPLPPDPAVPRDTVSDGAKAASANAGSAPGSADDQRPAEVTQDQQPDRSVNGHKPVTAH